MAVLIMGRQHNRQAYDAVKRAEALMRTIVGDKRTDRYLRTGRLAIPSPHHPERTYVWQQHHATLCLVNGFPLAHGCIQCTQRIGAPEIDIAISHWLLIHANETRWVGIANWSVAFISRKGDNERMMQFRKLFAELKTEHEHGRAIIHAEEMRESRPALRSIEPAQRRQPNWIWNYYPTTATYNGMVAGMASTITYTAFATGGTITVGPVGNTVTITYPTTHQ